jgi:hypothetical protein
MSNLHAVLLPDPIPPHTPNTLNDDADDDDSFIGLLSLDIFKEEEDGDVLGETTNETAVVVKLETG